MKQVRNCIFVLFLLLVASIQSSLALEYRVVNCGALDGAVYTASGGLSIGWGINNRGEVVGCSNNALGQQRGIIWDETNGLRELTIGSQPTLYGHAINNNGVALTDGVLLWNGVGISPGFFARDLNDKQQVVGSHDVAGAESATLWDPATGTTDLGILAGTEASWAAAINNCGQAVGDSMSWPGGYRAWIWDAESGMRDLGMVEGYDQSRCYDINDKGEVLGYATADVGYDRSITYFMWDEIHGIRTLESLGLPASCSAVAINNRSQIIGHMMTAQGALIPYVWDSSSGITLLDSLGGAGSSVFGINDNGWIVGQSSNELGDYYACVWIPVPEPSSASALLIALAGAGMSAYRRYRASRM